VARISAHTSTFAAKSAGLIARIDQSFRAPDFERGEILRPANADSARFCGGHTRFGVERVLSTDFVGRFATTGLNDVQNRSQERQTKPALFLEPSRQILLQQRV
jgi:hypothetical protein